MSDTVHHVPPFTPPDHSRLLAPHRRRSVAAPRPNARQWARHIALFLLTALTATFAGVLLATETTLPDPDLASPARWFDYLTYVPKFYALTVAAIAGDALAHPTLLAEGATFAAALLAILAAHEAGHYLACRRYGVDATLPFFIPAPPLFLAGTFGAFIKIKSPIPTRRALFDIGVAGPLAGFAVIVPVALIAVLSAHPAPASPSQLGGVIIFNDPPLLRLLSRALQRPLDFIAFKPFYYAAWIGLLVTSLNLLPVGQLDGGHAVFSIFGARVHRWTGRLAFAAVCALAVLGGTRHGAPSGFVYAVLLFIMLRVRHPETRDELAPPGRARFFVALLTLTVFALSFTPFPVTLLP